MSKSPVFCFTLLMVALCFGCASEQQNDSNSAYAGAAGSVAATGGAHSGGTGGSKTGGTGGTATGGTGGAHGDAGSGAGGSSGVFPAGVTTPKIMIVGDSISAGPGCWKKYLLKNLQDNGYTKFAFVGQYDDACGGGVRHSAVSCTTTTNYTQATFTVPNCFGANVYPGMSTLVTTHKPDMVLIQLGVNDVWGGQAPIDPILANYKTLVQQARAKNPHVVVVVAQIHKIITDNCTNTASTTNAQQLIEAVPAWAKGVTTAQSPVFVADLWTNSDPHEAADCVHPNDAGAQRMGLNWYNALKDLLPKN